MLRGYSFLFLLFIFISHALSAAAQPPGPGNWWMYWGNMRISKKWNWHQELQYRNYNFIGNTEQLLIRTGIGYDISENNNNILLGYAFIHSEPYIAGTDNKRSGSEHRIFQQFITRQVYPHFILQHRYRIEERFTENKSDVQMRFRYFLSAAIPVNKPSLTAGAVYLSAYNEVFINAMPSFFDRNRVYGAAGYVANKYLRFELGLMRQLLNANSRNQLQIGIYGAY